VIQFQSLGARIVVQLLQGQTNEPATKAVSDDDDFGRFNFVVYRLQEIHKMSCRLRYLKDILAIAKDRFVAGPIESNNVRIDIQVPRYLGAVRCADRK
jgi:hypothetical protein